MNSKILLMKYNIKVDGHLLDEMIIL